MGVYNSMAYSTICGPPIIVTQLGTYMEDGSVMGYVGNTQSGHMSSQVVV